MEIILDILESTLFTLLSVFLSYPGGVFLFFGLIWQTGKICW